MSLYIAVSEIFHGIRLSTLTARHTKCLEFFVINCYKSTEHSFALNFLVFRCGTVKKIPVLGQYSRSESEFLYIVDIKIKG